MKKLLCLTIILTLLFAFAGCEMPAGKIEPTKIIFVGYCENYEQYQQKIQASQYLTEHPSLSEVSENEFVSVSEGTETYVIIPADSTVSVQVCKLTNDYDENIGGTIKSELLYESTKTTPIVIKCNFSDIVSDVNVVIKHGDGTVNEFSPQISLKDGKVEIISESKNLIDDLTKY